MTSDVDEVAVEQLLKGFKPSTEIGKRYKWAIENPNLLTIAALQEEWIRFAEHIIKTYEADRKADRAAILEADAWLEWAENEKELTETKLRRAINEARKELKPKLEADSESAKEQSRA